MKSERKSLPKVDRRATAVARDIAASARRETGDAVSAQDLADDDRTVALVLEAVDLDDRDVDRLWEEVPVEVGEGDLVSLTERAASTARTPSRDVHSETVDASRSSVSTPPSRRERVARRLRAPDPSYTTDEE